MPTLPMRSGWDSLVDGDMVSECFELFDGLRASRISVSVAAADTRGTTIYFKG